MNKINTKLLWTAAVISLLCTLLFYQYLSSLEKVELDKKYVEIIIAKQDITPNTKISESLIETKKVLADSVVDLPRANKNDIVGKYVKETILKGEMIKKERLVADNQKGLAMKIPEGKRAVSILVNEYIAVGDLIQPGNYVDIYYSLKEKTVETPAGKINYINMTKLLLQNVQVLAVSKQYKVDDKAREKTPASYSVTVAVSPMEAEKLVYSEAFGTIKLALRAINEKGIENITEVNEVSMRN